MTWSGSTHSESLDRDGSMITRRQDAADQGGAASRSAAAPPITVQSMTKTDTRDVQATLLEIWSLEAAGCDIVRCAVAGSRKRPRSSLRSRKQIRIPLVAGHPLQLQAGVDRARAGRRRPAAQSRQHRRQAVSCKRSSTSPRTRRSRSASAVNGGSLEKDLLAKHQRADRGRHGRVGAPSHPHPRGSETIPR